MVDWDRVQELRSKGWDWSDIAADPKVDFHADASAGSPGRALRALYHRTGRQNAPPPAEAAPAKKGRKEEADRKWTLLRIGYLAVPAAGVWFLLAYFAPSPVGLLVPAIPYVALGLAGVAFVLAYALWRRTDGRRWSPVYRTTVIGGVVLGLVVSGAIGLTGSIVFGCPYLPPASSLNGQGGPGWATASVNAWQENGVPVVFFYGATWCPYCSASSWAVYKALTEFGSVTGAYTSHSSTSDIAPGTPEVVLASISVGAKSGHGPDVDFQPSEDTSGVRGTYPGTASCYQQAYVTSYAAGIPFLVVNGQSVHRGSFILPAKLGAWSEANMSNGTTVVQKSVLSESTVPGYGDPWSVVQTSAWWIMAYIAKDLGYTPSTVSTLHTDFGWSQNTTSAVTNMLGIIT
ncbi:MAG TPA: DUF929 family protein [Thermoplasmata archaeon]|nr:DUF929 family protein [Thermoplasmata archaeon]